jgi:hypothetical protein
MNIPTVEQARSAGELIDNLRSDLIGSQQRVVDLEEALREQADSFDGEIVTLRGRLHTSQKILDERDARIHYLETEQTLWLQERERFVTIAGLIHDAVSKMKESIGNAVTDGIQRERDARREPEPVQFDPDTTVTRIPRQEFFRRLEQTLTEMQTDGDVVQPDGTEDQGDSDQADGSESLPQFLKRAPTISPGQQGDPQ